jgi:hypothetical protein
VEAVTELEVDAELDQLRRPFQQSRKFSLDLMAQVFVIELKK